MVYCLVPRDLAAKLQRPLTRLWQDNESIELVVERRGADRRETGERRSPSPEGPPRVVDRRRVRYPDGRRVAERRALLVPVAVPNLPRRARHHVARLEFVEALPFPADLLEGVEAVRSIIRLQSGDERGLAELHVRYFDRLFTYLRVALKRTPAAEECTHEVFVSAIEELRHVTPGPAEVAPWLFGLAHTVSIAAHAKPAAVTPNGHGTGADGDRDAGTGLESLDWLADDELVMLIERRPLEERRVLMLRYMARLGFADIATVLGVTATRAEELHGQAVRALETSLAAVTRSPEVGGRHPIRVRERQTPVLRERLRALAA